MERVRVCCSVWNGSKYDFCSTFTVLAKSPKNVFRTVQSALKGYKKTKRGGSKKGRRTRLSEEITNVNL